MTAAQKTKQITARERHSKTQWVPSLCGLMAITPQHEWVNANSWSLAHADVLTKAECEALRQAYLRGATGSLLIGLRETLRIVTTMLPVVSTQDAAARQTVRAATKLKAMRCNGYVLARKRAFTVPGSSSRLRLALIIREHCSTHLAEKIIWLDEAGQAYAFDSGLSDAATQALERIL